MLQPAMTAVAVARSDAGNHSSASAVGAAIAAGPAAALATNDRCWWHLWEP